ncbi:recombinase family protein [Kitasatospora sp. NPDC094028]
MVGSRVSDTHGNEGKVSHLVQAESATRHALAKEWEIVGSFEDLDVSAEVTPWKRPDLGPWLTERQGEWDALLWAKVDRAFRSAKDCAGVARLADLAMMVRRFIPGEDHTEQLNHVTVAMKDLRGEKRRNLFDYQTFADAWTRADQEHRRQLLLGPKARLYTTPTIDGWHPPAELEARVRQRECARSSA